MRCKVFVRGSFLQLSVPDKVLIPERYVESDPEEALSPEQEADKQRKVNRIKALIARNRYWTRLLRPLMLCSRHWTERLSLQVSAAYLHQQGPCRK